MESDESAFVAWPDPPLTLRARRIESGFGCGVVTARNRHGVSRLSVEAGLLESEDWSAHWITPAEQGEEGRPSYMRHAFNLRGAESGVTIERARLYATSAGINQLHLNGDVVGTKQCVLPRMVRHMRLDSTTRPTM